jgi:hypothetical protein
MLLKTFEWQTAHLFERVETSQNGPAYPRGIFAFGWRINLDLDVFNR